ncbi:hypothetical protein BOTBODRAFT_55831 [Botryobasidium botryosum FD-172 SS1]|uniref:G-protein coupled receptors family 1 profile domain-containing protein n=1 Tax=Botryobasidium botryosum (strain FD-172 SS1) TaxID=930990 RepID=A0A067MGJ4_BOTB1|nr:hypothetical protein BOTBODRAFT_55831 [Botryobasidium botryosum FD-172 SS1]
MPDLTLTESILISTWVEGIFYGVYALLFGTTSYILICSKFRAKCASWKLLSTSFFMFILSTSHLAVNIRLTVETLIGHVDHFAGVYSYWAIVSSSIYLVITFIGDAVVIYRTYLLWDRTFSVVALPIILHISSTAASVYSTISMSQLHPGQSAYDGRTGTYIRTHIILTLALNIMCTALVIAQLRNSTYLEESTRSGSSRSRRGGRYHRALIMIVESAALYTLSTAVYFALFTAGLQSAGVVFAMNAQIMCIVQALLTLRIGLGPGHIWTHSEGQSTTLQMGDTDSFVATTLSNDRTMIQPSLSHFSHEVTILPNEKV